MNNPTSLNVLFYIKNDKIDKNGLVPIYSRITIDGKRAEVYINRKILPSRWDSHANCVKGNKEDARSINIQIDSITTKIHDVKRDMLDRNEFITAVAIKNRLIGIDKRHKTILEVFKYHNKQMKELEGKTYASATVKRYDTTLNHISEFIEHEYGTNDMYLKQMDYSFVTNLEKYFKVVKNCNHNSSIKYIKNFKKVINLAIANDWLDKDPFLKYKVTLKESKREFLSQEELIKLETKEITIPRLDVIRDVFIFSCYTGLAYVDVANLTPNHIVTGIDGEKWIYTYREKTEVKSNIPLLPKALEIIEKYKDHPESSIKGKLLPVSSNQKTNAYLKEIADICSINKVLSFHIARHTCATWLLTMGVPIETVSSILGHKSIKTTQIYAKVIEKKVSEDMTQLREKLNNHSLNNKSNGTTNS
ncbi:MAG: site-specific integrase [Bacteroidales bacterium]|nr:site-specific integrase [Bacteroidales bacterium]